jgi:hypothetical protein
MPTLLRLALGKSPGIAISVILVIGMLARMWRSRHSSAESSEYIQALAASMLVALLVLPILPSFNQVLLLLPVMMMIRDYSVLHRVVRWSLTIFLALPWVARLILLFLHPPVDSMNKIPLLPSAIAVLVPVVLPLVLAAQQSRGSTMQPSL